MHAHPPKARCCRKQHSPTARYCRKQHSPTARYCRKQHSPTARCCRKQHSPTVRLTQEQCWHTWRWSARSFRWICPHTSPAWGQSTRPKGHLARWTDSSLSFIVSLHSEGRSAASLAASFLTPFGQCTSSSSICVLSALFGTNWFEPLGVLSRGHGRLVSFSRSEQLRQNVCPQLTAMTGSRRTWSQSGHNSHLGGSVTYLILLRSDRDTTPWDESEDNTGASEDGLQRVAILTIAQDHRGLFPSSLCLRTMQPRARLQICRKFPACEPQM